jgi:hypothetical protein
VLPEDDEIEAESLMRLARSFMATRSYRAAKGLLQSVLGEYPTSRSAPAARAALRAEELASIDIPPYVRQPRPSAADGPLTPAGPVPSLPEPRDAGRTGHIPLPGEDGKTVFVRGYVRRDGTYVPSYTRHPPRR